VPKFGHVSLYKLRMVIKARFSALRSSGVSRGGMGQCRL